MTPEQQAAKKARIKMKRIRESRYFKNSNPRLNALGWDEELLNIYWRGLIAWIIGEAWKGQLWFQYITKTLKGNRGILFQKTWTNRIATAVKLNMTVNAGSKWLQKIFLELWNLPYHWFIISFKLYQITLKGGVLTIIARI